MFSIAGITTTACIFGYFFKPLQPTGAQVKQAAEIAKEYMEERDLDDENHDIIDDTNKYIPTGTVIERLPRLSHNESTTINPATPFLSTLSLNVNFLN